MSVPENALARAMLLQAPDAVIFADRSGAIREWNRRAETMFGFGCDEAIGRSLDIIIPERLRQAHWRGFRAAVGSGHTKTQGHAVLTRAVRKDGSKLYVEISFSLVVEETGGVAGALAIARDVTERQEAARKAAHS